MLADTCLAMEYNGEMYYYVYNIVGDVKGMYDSDGNVVAKYSYSGYGDKGTVLLSPFLDNTKMIVYYPIG